MVSHRPLEQRRSSGGNRVLEGFRLIYATIGETKEWSGAERRSRPSWAGTTRADTRGYSEPELFRTPSSPARRSSHHPCTEQSSGAQLRAAGSRPRSHFASRGAAEEKVSDVPCSSECGSAGIEFLTTPIQLLAN